jgi:hypothetical protein
MLGSLCYHKPHLHQLVMLMGPLGHNSFEIRSPLNALRDTIVWFPCRYHCECISPWLLRNRLCPLCKQAAGEPAAEELPLLVREIEQQRALLEQPRSPSAMGNWRTWELNVWAASIGGGGRGALDNPTDPTFAAMAN